MVSCVQRVQNVITNAKVERLAASGQQAPRRFCAGGTTVLNNQEFVYVL